MAVPAEIVITNVNGQSVEGNVRRTVMIQYSYA